MTLTREEILAMDPGRELDARVAIYVMGFKEITIVGKYYFTDPIDTVLKSYSTNISAAWEVLEKFKQYTVMRAVGWDKEYDCRIWVGITGDQWSVQAKTAPEAICKAALLAVMKV